MLTIVETTLFQRQWPMYWTEEERGQFAAFLADNPEAGDVVPQSGGIRKVRLVVSGLGKAGAVCVIDFSRREWGQFVLLTWYAKSSTDNLTGPQLKEIRRVRES